MVTVCCFQCDPRLATYAISVVSFLVSLKLVFVMLNSLLLNNSGIIIHFKHFGIESVLIVSLDEEHRLVAEDDGIKFYSKVNQFSML